MLTMARMGSGLLYYLDGPPTDRLENHFQNDNNLGRSRQIKAAFSRALPEDVKEYIVLRSNDVSNYERILAPHIQTVFSNSEWTVWRRNSQQPVELQPPVSPAP